MVCAQRFCTAGDWAERQKNLRTCRCPLWLAASECLVCTFCSAPAFFSLFFFFALQRICVATMRIPAVETSSTENAHTKVLVGGYTNCRNSYLHGLVGRRLGAVEGLWAFLSHKAFVRQRIARPFSDSEGTTHRLPHASRCVVCLRKVTLQDPEGCRRKPASFRALFCRTKLLFGSESHGRSPTRRHHPPLASCVCCSPRRPPATSQRDLLPRPSVVWSFTGILGGRARVEGDDRFERMEVRCPAYRFIFLLIDFLDSLVLFLF